MCWHHFVEKTVRASLRYLSERPKESLANWYPLIITPPFVPCRDRLSPFLVTFPRLGSRSANDSTSLLRWGSFRCIVHWIPAPLRLVGTLRLLQLVRILSIIAIVAVEGRACGLVGDRWFVRRSCTAIVRLVIVVSTISILWAVRRFIAPVSSHPTSSIHGCHAATAAATGIVA